MFACAVTGSDEERRTSACEQSILIIAISTSSMESDVSLEYFESLSETKKSRIWNNIVSTNKD